ncbi:MAG: hypothetical protein ABL923_12880 [Burkholderiaceae bacterium]
MFTTSQNHPAEIRRLQDMAAIRLAAKHRAEQLRQEAIDSFFQAIGSTVLAAVRRITARQPNASQTRALES